jgi:branched-chain amino acid transport system ATP-binding protein
MTSCPLLSVQRVSKRYGGVAALLNVSFDLDEGAIISVIGSNGAGKTTLFDVISGYTRADSGRVLVRGASITGARPDSIARLGVTRSFQTTRLARRLSVMDNLLLAAGGRSERMLERLGLVTPLMERSNAQAILAEVGLDVEMSQTAGALSFGHQRLLGLALCAVGDFDILLLDEPFAGINGSIVESIIALLLRWKAVGKGILIVEHNINAVVGMSDRVVVLSGGRILKIAAPRELLKADDVLNEFVR